MIDIDREDLIFEHDGVIYTNKQLNEVDMTTPKSKMKFTDPMEAVNLDRMREARKARDGKRRAEAKQYKVRKDEMDREKYQKHIKEVKELLYVKEYVGSAGIMPSDPSRRLANILEFIDIMYEANKAKKVNGPIFNMSASWRNKLKNKAADVINYFDTINKCDNMTEYNPKDLQGLLSTSFINSKTGEANQDKTIEGYRNQFQLVNLIENVIYDNDIDYISNVRTREELQHIDEYTKAVKTPEKGCRAKPIQSSDVDKILNYIADKNKGDFTKSPEAHVIAFLGAEFGMRRGTIELLTINDIDVKNGVIRVPAAKNKSGVPYTTVSISDSVSRELGQIVQRAMEKNYGKPDKNGEIRLVVSSKSNQYKEFDRLMRNAGVDMEKYKENKFHALRRYYGQAAWDMYRSGYYQEDKTGCKIFINEALGHNPKELKHLDAYVSDMW